MPAIEKPELLELPVTIKSERVLCDLTAQVTAQPFFAPSTLIAKS